MSRRSGVHDGRYWVFMIARIRISRLSISRLSIYTTLSNNLIMDNLFYDNRPRIQARALFIVLSANDNILVSLIFQSIYIFL
jgi:hypothetical protein